MLNTLNYTEALLYDQLTEKKVKCSLCAHRCSIKEGRRGICRVRENKDGKLYTLVQNRPCSFAIDPIEKKPLFHFIPGSKTFSLCTVGCNFKCLHCQNAGISQYPSLNKDTIVGNDTTPADVIHAAEGGGCRTISYTYTEPTVYMEFALECAVEAHRKGFKNVFVSNGYMTPESAEMIAPYLDGNNIDLKGDNEFYKKVCGARVEPVLETIKLMKERGVWVEITTLIIPGYNDSERVLNGIIDFILSVDNSIPWHVTRFHPTHKLIKAESTPLETLQLARNTGMKKGLKFVYEGNTRAGSGESTYCYECNSLLIERAGFSIYNNRLKDGKCPECKAFIEGVW